MWGGATEHRAMCWGDTVLKHDDSLNLDYLEYQRKHELEMTNLCDYARHACMPHMTIQAGARCLSNGPENFSNQDDPLYLAAVA